MDATDLVFPSHSHLHAAHGLLSYLSQTGGASRDELRKRSKTLSRSGSAGPQRMDQMLRTLAHLGLVEMAGEEASLTGVGKDYQAAGSGADGGVTDGQATILRAAILDGHADERFARMLGFALTTWQRERPGTDAEFGEAMRTALDETWAPRTAENRGKWTANLLRDLRLVSDVRELTGEGIELLNKVAPGDERWREFLWFAERFFHWEGFPAEETDYKLRLAEKVSKVRSHLLAGEEWRDALKATLADRDQNIVGWRVVHNQIKPWLEREPDEAGEALRALWREGPSLDERMDAFLAAFPTDVVSGGGTRTNVMSFLLLGLDAFKLPPYKPSAVHIFIGAVGEEPVDGSGTEKERYEQLLDFLDRMLEKAPEVGMLSRLDAQGAAWAVAQWQLDTLPATEWSEAERQRLRKLRGEEIAEVPENESPEEHDALDSELIELGRKLFFEPEGYLLSVRGLLEDRGQVIFYGPPGTGKTYVAREFARTLAEEDDRRVKLVQFHPSYSYEDFVEGFRPGNRGEFRLVPGPLKKLAEAARADPEARYLLVVDELNRGNVGKILGELYFLLEYRDEEIELQYSAEPFQLPSNLWVIGTMNTADRSIALMDAALRRRFYFVPFFPDRPPIRGLLRRWLLADEERRAYAWLADVVDEANERLGDRHAGIGPSYFLRQDLSLSTIETVWEFGVKGYLAERLLGEEDRLDCEFDLADLRGSGDGEIATPAAREDAGMDWSAPTYVDT